MEIGLVGHKCGLVVKTVLPSARSRGVQKFFLIMMLLTVAMILFATFRDRIFK